MKAIQVSATGGPDVLQYTEVAKPVPGKGQLLVRNKIAGVNYIDTYHRTGLYPLPLPFIPGREASGVIEAVGEGVSGFHIGERVAFFGPQTYAEFSCANADTTTKLPDDVTFEAGAAAILQGLTALMLTRECYRVKSGDRVLVHAAAGGVGQVLCQICKALGAYVIGTCSTPEKAAIAKAAGATEVILYTEQYVVTEVKRLTGGDGVHVAYDGVGKTTFGASLSSLRRRGTLVCFGNASGKPEPFDILRLSKAGSVTLMRPTLGDYIATKEEFTKLATDLFENYIRPGKVRFQVHKTYPLAEAAQAHTDLESRNTTGKLLLKVAE